jgi:hypothetical protein
MLTFSRSINISLVQVLMSTLSAVCCWKLASISDDFPRSWQVADSWCVFDEDWKHVAISWFVSKKLRFCLAVRITFKWLWMTDFFILSPITYTQNYGARRILRTGIELWKMIKDTWLNRPCRWIYHLPPKICIHLQDYRARPRNGVGMLLWIVVTLLQDYTVSQPRISKSEIYMCLNW